MRRCPLSPLLIALFLWTSAAQAASPMDRLTWLTGCWAADSGEPETVEHWLPLAGDTLLGVGRTVKAGKTVAFEFLQIRTRDDGAVIYVAQPSGRPPTTFVATRIAARSVTFENPDHDFPQRIRYRLHDRSRLNARVEGMRNGEWRGFDLPMTRIRCDDPGHAVGR